MRWVLLTDDASPRIGGVATFVDRVGAGLARQGHDVCLVRRYRRGGRAPEGVRMHSAWGPSFSRRAGRWLALRAAPALWRADAVLAVTWICGTTAARLGVPLHVVAHGSDVTCAPRSPVAFDRVWRSARGRFALSRYLAEAVGRRGFDATILPAPVDAAVRPVDLRRRDRWGLIARATPDKGGDRFVRLVAAAGVEGVVVGSGPALATWRRLADALGARIRFEGSVPGPRIPALLATLDLVCLLPRTGSTGAEEGLGLVLLEAAAAGVPVVGCRTGGVPEAVGPGLILTDPDDAMASAAAIADWWRPDRGIEAWRWVSAHHGVGRTLSALDAAAQVARDYTSTRMEVDGVDD